MRETGLYLGVDVGEHGVEGFWVLRGGGGEEGAEVAGFYGGGYAEVGEGGEVGYYWDEWLGWAWGVGR